MKKKWKWLLTGLLALGVYLDNKRIVRRDHYLFYENLPKEYDSLRIVHLSDFHNALFSKDNRVLVEMIRQSRPEVIFMTGDIIYRRKSREDIAFHLLEKLVEMAPVYYVTGNHETVIDMNAMALRMEELGVQVLRNKRADFLRKGAQSPITIYGLEDPRFFGENYEQLEENLVSLLSEEDQFSILLSHRPECFPIYQNKGIDLVFSGHIHGGQIRIPFLGGVLSPQRSFFPAYDKGIYKENGVIMSVSGGLGNSVIPVRICNPSEFSLHVLKRKECYEKIT